MYMVIHYWLTIPETFNHYNFAWLSKHQSSAKTQFKGIVPTEATFVNYVYYKNCTIV